MTTPAAAQIAVELLRRLADGTLAPWRLNQDGSEPVADAEVRARLVEIRDRLPATGTGATEATLALLPPLLDGVETLLGRLPATGAASDAGLAAIVTALGPKVAAADLAALATEATLAQRATEATLLQVRDLVDGVEGLLTTLRDTVLRRTDPLPAGNNTIGHVLTDLVARTLLNLGSAARTTGVGTTGALDTSSLTRVALDVDVTAMSGTLSPTLTIFVDRQRADGGWSQIYESPAITTVRTLATSIGQGMTIGQSLGAAIRFRWSITGTSASFTFSASIVGK